MSWRTDGTRHYDLQENDEGMCFIDGALASREGYDALQARTVVVDEYDPTGYHARREKRREEDLDGCMPLIGWGVVIAVVVFVAYGLMIAFGLRM